ncbi:hypothetical protein AKG11_03685 [Shinella sp. SUS2]|uniref:hypothetical protein n=1 Tax=unclassified Shinella TaxID=2643062 RepID=UPI0006812880|nr:MULTISPECIES: hypothetical protein [unclassified Shinella]KNY18245.1 hypothetical protein AKG11_03685 [Shinella sp. SUS2]KOC77440.1 hypothetical protein AKG10_01155 [Shinella sp. GWS1]
MAQTGKLIVLAAYSKTDDGDLLPAFEPRQIETEEKAMRIARTMAGEYAGVIAWSRDADIALGDYGPPTILFQSGDLPDME